MKNLVKIVIPIGILIFLLAALVSIAPLGAAAREGTVPSSSQMVGPETNPVPQERVSAALVLPGTDLALSGTGGRLPEIAANDEFAAAVFEIGSGVYIRAAQKGSGWGFIQLVASNADTPRLAFQQTGANNVVHVVWDAGSGQYIRHATCTLSDPIITCGAATNIATWTSSGRFRSPDVVVDSSNGVHVAWVDRNNLLDQTDNQIKTARSGNGGVSWNTTTVDTLADGGDSGGQPVLATDGNQYVHLAFKEYGDTAGAWIVHYRRSGIGSHSWSTSSGYSDGHILNFEEMSNPAVAAVGNKVYLAWDNDRTSKANYFGLTGAEGSSDGSSWPTYPIHIPSKLQTNNAPGTDDEKASYDSATPIEETGLRPSLAVRTDGNFSIVWQQRPGLGEEDNCTSEIYYAPDSSDWSSGWGTVTDNSNEYSIDPDIAIDDNGIHVVFMKAADDGSCQGGNTNGYTVYYRGPFDSYSTKGSQIFMPIILK